MKNKLFLKLSGVVIGVLLLLGILLLSTKMPNEQNNGFDRHWLKQSLTEIKNTPTITPLTGICGISSNHVFFTNRNPQCFLMMDKGLTKLDTFMVDINVSTKLRSAYTLTVDSPWMYLHANNLKSVVFGQLNSDSIVVTPLNTEIFTRSAQISQNSIVVRAFDSTQQTQIFQRIDNHTGKVLKQASIIEGQEDAGFSTDGILRYDNVSHRLIYVQYYQNRFFCLDTNLNVLYTSHTIDTSYVNPVKVKKVLTSKTGGSMMPSAARDEVNRDCIVNNGYIYILSGLRADNETDLDFNKNMAVDVYNIENGIYLGSFYIPSLDSQRCRTMSIDKNLLVALYKDKVATYHLNISK